VHSRRRPVATARQRKRETVVTLRASDIEKKIVRVAIGEMAGKDLEAEQGRGGGLRWGEYVRQAEKTDVKERKKSERSLSWGRTKPN